MIPKAAAFALSALICLCTAFGFVLRGIVDEARKDRQNGKEDPYERDSWEDDIS